MNKNLIKFGMFLLGLMLFTAIDSFGQMRRSTRVYRGYGSGYHRAPRVSVGIGVGGYWGAHPYYGYGYGYRRYRPGVSVGIGFPGIGATIYSMPRGYSRFYFGGMPYFYFNNTFYLQRDRGYEVVAPPLGATLDRLPSGARLRKIDGVNYYEVNGTYLLPEINSTGKKSYIVVGTDGELNTDDAMDARSRSGSYEEEEDGPLRNQRYNDRDDDEEDVVVRNGNTDGDEVYSVRPQVGDQFDQLPRNSKSVVVKGKRLYESPNGTYYKEITVNGTKVYEVVDGY